MPDSRELSGVPTWLLKQLKVATQKGQLIVAFQPDYQKTSTQICTPTPITQKVNSKWRFNYAKKLN